MSISDTIPTDASAGEPNEAPFMWAYESVTDGRWQAFNRQLERADGSIVPGVPLYRKPQPHPSQQAGTEGMSIADAKWLSGWLSHEKDGGHCGEGTFERRERASWNDRIDRILAALNTSEARG